MASSSGGSRKGAGRRTKHSKPYDERVSTLKLEKLVFERWSALKVRKELKTNTHVAQYLLDLADAFDQQLLQT